MAKIEALDLRKEHQYLDEYQTVDGKYDRTTSRKISKGPLVYVQRNTYTRIRNYTLINR